jgi:type IV secretion system protein VirD4
VTESGKRGSSLNQISRSFREIERPLMTADEVMHMRAPTKEAESGKITHPGDMLIFGAGQYAIYGTQILYFTDPVFLERSMVKPPTTMTITFKPPPQRVTTPKPAGASQEAVVVPFRA